MLLNAIMLVVSFVLLYHGAKWLVDGGSALAEALNISKVVVGVVLVAFGTSAPELFVNIIASSHGHSDFALSNVSGSNMANICLGYGLCAIFGVLAINKSKFKVDLLYFACVPLIIIFFLLIYPQNIVPLWGSAVLLIILFLYIRSIKSRLFENPEASSKMNGSFYKGLAIFLIGVVTLYISGEMIVKNALAIGAGFGLSEDIMGLTVVAIGTSIPDITASVVAIRKNETSIAVGNLLGSNIFNVLLVLSSSLLAGRSSIHAENVISIDYIIVFVLSAIFVVMALKMKRIGKVSGLGLVLVYFAYLAVRLFLL